MPHRPERALAFVRQAWTRQRLAHAWLISGHEADNEALASRIAALVLKQPETSPQNPPSLDQLPQEWLRVLRPEKKSRRIPVASLRQAERFFHFAAPAGQWKVIVIAEAERMMPEAANAFLKTLEEPPENCLILLHSEFPERLLPTIRSRCVLLELERPPRPLSAEERALANLLARVEPGPKLGLPQVAQLRQGFIEILDARKEALVKERDASLAAEKKQLRDRADNGWVEAREAALAAHTEAEVVALRATQVALLGRWLGDALRHLESPQTPPTLPEFASQTAAWARRDGRNLLLQRLDAHHHLERLLETNVNDSLLWEVSFLEIFLPADAASLATVSG